MGRKHGKRSREARLLKRGRCSVTSVALIHTHRSPPCPLATLWRMVTASFYWIVPPFAHKDKHICSCQEVRVPGKKYAHVAHQEQLHRVICSPASRSTSSSDGRELGAIKEAVN